MTDREFLLYCSVIDGVFNNLHFFTENRNELTGREVAIYIKQTADYITTALTEANNNAE